MKKTLGFVATLGMLLGVALVGPAGASSHTPLADRQAQCAALGGTWDEGTSGSWNTDTCTVTTTEWVTSTEQVNNIRAAKQVLRTTSQQITYQTVYTYAANREIAEEGTDGDPEVGETTLVQCTPGSGYEACPDA